MKKYSNIAIYRFDDKTSNTIKKKAAESHLSESEYIRRLINSDTTPVEKDILNKIMHYVAYMGNNINQIAHQLNLGMFDNCDIDKIEDFKVALYEFKIELAKIREKYN